MAVSGRTSKISSIVAAFCIVIYIAAIAFGVVQVILNIGERRNLASGEFEDLADKASSSAVILGFMSEAYQETIKDFIDSSETLSGVIITGPAGEYAFERYQGRCIVWAGDSPRFKARAGLFGEPFYLPLRIDGQRNVNIRADYSYIDQDLFLTVLRNTLLAILSALALAFITLLVELTAKSKDANYRIAAAKPAPESKTGAMVPQKEEGFPETETAFSETPKTGENFTIFDPPQAPPPLDDTLFTDAPGLSDTPFGDVTFDETEEPAVPFGDIDFPKDDEEDHSEGFSADENLQADEPSGDKHPQGLFTPRGNVGWESYTHDRLASELHRCASFEQDLVFMAIEFRDKDTAGDALYRKFTDEAVSFFTMRDLIFEKGENGISVIVPSADLEQGITKSEEFRARVIAKLPESFEGRSNLFIGLSSRSGRLIDADRLMLEASTALEKALDDPTSPIIAFKSDLEKYREFVKRGGRQV